MTTVSGIHLHQKRVNDLRITPSLLRNAYSKMSVRPRREAIVVAVPFVVKRPGTSLGDLSRGDVATFRLKIEVPGACHHSML